MIPIQHIQTEVDKADALLTTAEDLMSDGRIVSIAALSDIIGNICRLIKEEGYARCRTLKPVLARLSDQIDRFRLMTEKQLADHKEPHTIERQS